METQGYYERQEMQSRGGQRRELTLKILLIAGLILLLGIPMLMVYGLISDRRSTANQAQEEVYGSWSGPQMIAGPVVTIPYRAQDSDGKSIVKYLNYLPETLEVEGEVKTETLKRGLYEVIVYRSPIRVKGRFAPIALEEHNLSPDRIRHNEITVNVGISDLRGIENQVVLNWGNEKLDFVPGIDLHALACSGMSAKGDFSALFVSDTAGVDFSFTLQLKGSGSLLFVPIGKATEVNLVSNCFTPSFTGAFLPSEREVKEDGFSARWKVFDLNRNFSQVLHADENPNGYGSSAFVDVDYRMSSLLRNGDVASSIFGVDFLLPVDQYQKATRSVKYAFLIIILTFVVCFFVEVTRKRNIHPFQYLLVGLALCLFYTLLIALSEHVSFGLAYGIATVMTISLITFYLYGVLKIRRTALVIGGLLLFLYLFVFFLLQLETYALLFGSIGLFVILAVVMYYSQKIEWYNK